MPNYIHTYGYMHNCTYIYKYMHMTSLLTYVYLHIIVSMVTNIPLYTYHWWMWIITPIA